MLVLLQRGCKAILIDALVSLEEVCDGCLTRCLRDASALHQIQRFGLAQIAPILEYRGHWCNDPHLLLNSIVLNFGHQLWISYS